MQSLGGVVAVSVWLESWQLTISHSTATTSQTFRLEAGTGSAFPICEILRLSDSVADEQFQT
jgi:hypothetical protein